MFSWLIVILAAYLFFSLSFFGDKLMLSHPKTSTPKEEASKPSPKLYTFYVGMLGILVVVVIPFIDFVVPSMTATLWVALSSLTFILAINFMFSALAKFEVSKVVPAIGAFQPILIFILARIFFGPQVFSKTNLLAFVILVLGSFLISTEGRLKINAHYMALVSVASLMFSLNYVFTKLVFLSMPFLSGLVWINIFSVLFVLLLLFDRELVSTIFVKRTAYTKENSFHFIFSQSMGAIAGFLQNWAISLAPVGYLAIMNSLRGVQYVFLFLVTLFFSVVFPHVFEEKISQKIIIKKSLSILLIVLGLAILVLW